MNDIASSHIPPSLVELIERTDTQAHVLFFFLVALGLLLFLTAAVRRSRKSLVTV